MTSITTSAHYANIIETSAPAGKPMTPTIAACDAYRDEITASDERIHTKIWADSYRAVVYISQYELEGVTRFTLMSYKGRGKSMVDHHYYTSREARDQKVTQWLDRFSDKNSMRRKPDVRALKVDDVLVSSWGYDQTNIDYYKVVGLVGKSSVSVVEVGEFANADAFMQGSCVPNPNAVLSRPVTYRVDGTRIKVRSFAYAYLMEPKVVAGVAIYSAHRWSSYA